MNNLNPEGDGFSCIQPPVNGSGATVYCTTIKLLNSDNSAAANAHVVAAPVSGYGFNDMYTNASGQLFLWLPVGTTVTSITTENGTYTGTVTTNSTVVNDSTARIWGTASAEFKLQGEYFEPVTDITLSKTYVGTSTLSYAISPSTATKKTVVWTVENAGGTGATINGDQLTTGSAGMVTLKATITGGAAGRADFTKSFTIPVGYNANLHGVLTLSPMEVKPGDTVTATAQISSPDYGTLTYQWYRLFTPIPGAVGSTYTVTAADVGSRLICEAVSPFYNVGVGSGAPTNVVKADNSSTLKVAITGWTYGYTANAPTLSGYTADGTPAITYTYSGKANSGTALTDSATPPTEAGSYTVTAHYSDDSSLGTATASFTVAKDSVTGVVSYTTIHDTGKHLSDTAPISGFFFNSVKTSVKGSVAWKDPSTTEIKEGVSYTWIFTPTDSNNYDVASDSVILLQAAQSPQITTQPSDQSVYDGETATFAVVATGYPEPTYQWQVSLSPYNAGFSDIPGATSSSYTTPATTAKDDAARYQCVITNRGGSSTSRTANLTVMSTVCAYPVASPNEGAYCTAQSVTLTCYTPGAEIRYTLDGSTPTETSTLYTVPIPINTSTVLQAKAFRTGWTQSVMVQATYTILPVSVTGITTGQSITQGTTPSFTVQGGGMDNTSPVNGDYRFLPTAWETNPSGDFSSGYTQSFDTTGMTLGAHTLTITFTKQQYDGTAWANVSPLSTTTQSVNYALVAAQNSVPATTGGTGAPSTGDNSNPVLWLVLCVLSACVLVITLKKRRHF